MPERENGRGRRRRRRRRGAERKHPAWAEEQREQDLAWIRENLHVFWPVVEEAYAELGRGAIVVDTTRQPEEESGHPFGYFPREALEQYEDEDINRMLAEYDPSWEMVTVLLKEKERISMYRIGALGPEGEE